MGTDRQLEQLCSVYAERSDAELIALHENRDDLTDIAQQALAQVMKQRRISTSGVPVPQPETASLTDASASLLDDDEIELQVFDDAFRLNEAMRLLTVAEIAHRVVNLDKVDSRSNDTYRPVMQLALVVGRIDEAHARKLLQQGMKLFPAPENHDAFEEQGELMDVDVFSRSDALRIAHAFGSAGISFQWNDGRDDTTLAEDEVRVEVYQHRIEEANKLARQTLGA